MERFFAIVPLAERQFGRVGHAQLVYLGVSKGAITSWRSRGMLRKVLPRVYALGHAARSVEASLFEAVLYAGPGAALSHMTAAWWRGLIAFPDHVIHVSTPRRVPSLPGIVVHPRRNVERRLVRGIPTTSVEQAVLDLAATGEERLVRKALGQLDYHDSLDLHALDAVCGNGRPGSGLLRGMLAVHDPGFGRVNGEEEYDFLAQCQAWGVEPLPLIDQRIGGVQIDAYWPQQRFGVDLDGRQAHSSWAQIKHDRANELILRRHSVYLVRYHWDLIHAHGTEVRTEILRTLQERAPRGPIP